MARSRLLLAKSRLRIYPGSQQPAGRPAGRPRDTVPLEFPYCFRVRASARTVHGIHGIHGIHGNTRDTRNTREYTGIPGNTRLFWPEEAGSFGQKVTKKGTLFGHFWSKGACDFWPKVHDVSGNFWPKSRLTFGQKPASFGQKSPLLLAKRAGFLAKEAGSFGQKPA